MDFQYYQAEMIGFNNNNNNKTVLIYIAPYETPQGALQEKHMIKNENA